ncbi:WcbI family polysaccharide biosynthesis putative acetyltransferase [Anaerocolumna sp. AGMB13025]|uniref:WcbI family polysaccharide biosynthesis putative acetyltransferase n=1 Tax=Anaerocolumna sp. AGMB13025 TaxID=3039116 RepID=UPI00241D0FAF|nr:WcbI family polysaccharide biosynthesis putative acetyltransferase [Anaerocolumna sp. AGMB13025]WFR56788.1 WcbI family polysaccharide biosynthesis putative acetyltransferase [Anaerocolumna sp. AGMB13025]
MNTMKLPYNEISIWGTGGVGKRCYFQLKDNYNIKCFYDNNQNQKNEIVIDNIKKEDFKKDDSFIVIASSYWKEIMDQLKCRGLCLFRDFIPSFMIDNSVEIRILKHYFNNYEINTYINLIKKNKKIVVVFGNCQTSILEKMLLKNEKFSNDYFALIFPRVCDYTLNEIEDLVYNFDWTEVDLFIYQEVNNNNKFSEKLATDQIKKLMKSSCRTVCISNLYFAGYFPQAIQNNHNIYEELHKSGLFPIADKYIEEFIYKNKQGNEIIEIVNNPNFIDSADILNHCEDSINELIKREKLVDIKISDYIILNYKKEQLFYSFNHPSNLVLYEYANRILKFLGYIANDPMNEEDMYYFFGTLKAQDIPIYPSVIKTLKLEKFETNFFPNKYALGNYYLSFNEFIVEYIHQCFKK